MRINMRTHLCNLLVVVRLEFGTDIKQPSVLKLQDHRGSKVQAGFRNVFESIDRDGVVGPYLEMAVQMGVNCAIG